MKKIISVMLLSTLLILALSVGANTSASETRPKGFIPWYSFEDLNVGADCTNTNEDDPNSVEKGGTEVIGIAIPMDAKIKIAQNRIIEGGPAGKLMTFGAGEKFKSDNSRYAKDGYWCESTVCTLGTKEYSSKTFSTDGYFVFYIDTTKWSIPSRETTDDAKRASFFIYLGARQTAANGTVFDDGMYGLKLHANYETQDENGGWVQHESTGDDYTAIVQDPDTKEDITVPKQMTWTFIDTGYKGYVRMKLKDMYPLTYYNSTRVSSGFDKVDTVSPCKVYLQGGFFPESQGVGDDMPEPGHLAIGDFGFMPAETEVAETKVAETKVAETKEEESKEEESKTEDSKEEESKANESKAEESKEDESLISVATTKDNSSHKGLIVGIVIAVVVIIGGGATAFYFMVIKKKKINHSTESIEENEKENDANDSENPDDKMDE